MDEEAVKKVFHSPLKLQRKQREATDKHTRAALSAASYAHHFLDGSARVLDEIRTHLADLSRTAASESRTQQDGWRELDSLARESRDFLAHSQLATSDMTGTVVASDVNMTSALRDKLLTKLCPYLCPKHRGTLQNSGFHSDQLFPSLPEVGAAAREDAAHESTCQLAAMRLPQGSRPSSRIPLQAGGKRKALAWVEAKLTQAVWANPGPMAQALPSLPVPLAGGTRSNGTRQVEGTNVPPSIDSLRPLLDLPERQSQQGLLS